MPEIFSISPVTPDEGTHELTDEDPFADFRTHLELKNMSQNTIRAYLGAVKQFHSLYPEANHANLMLYKCYLIDHYKPQTINLRIRAMNSYMEFCQKPASKILMVRHQQKPFLENVISQADY